MVPRQALLPATPVESECFREPEEESSKTWLSAQAEELASMIGSFGLDVRRDHPAAGRRPTLAARADEPAAGIQGF